MAGPLVAVTSAPLDLLALTARVAGTTPGDGAVATFAGLVRTAFLQRRKTLANALRPFADPLGRDAASALSAAGIDPGARPETLDVAAFVRLAGVFGPLAAPKG